MQLSPLVVAVALVGALEPHKLNGLVKNRKKLENFARGVSPHITPPVRSRESRFQRRPVPWRHHHLYTGLSASSEPEKATSGFPR